MRADDRKIIEIMCRALADLPERDLASPAMRAISYAHAGIRGATALRLDDDAVNAEIANRAALLPRLMPETRTVH